MPPSVAAAPLNPAAAQRPTTSGRSGRLPFVVLLLALGTFLMSTTEFVIAGLLPEMASDLDVSLAKTGLLITAFAIGMIIGAPTMAVATLRLPRRMVLVVALLAFSAGHVLAAVSSSFTVVLAARVLTALVTGAFWSVATVVATAAAGAAASSKALGVMMSGVGLATVVGVPLGSWAGQHIGWRGAFWALVVLSAGAAVIIGRFVPPEQRQDIAPLRTQLAALRTGRLWLLLVGTVFVTGGYMATFSYISPLLTQRAGFSESAVPLILIGFGVGSLIGTNVGGRFADKKPLTTFITTSVAAGLVLLLLMAFSTSSAATVVLVILLGVTGMAVPPVATGLAVRFAASSPAMAAGLAVAAFNAGIALGTWIAGYTLGSHLGAIGPAVVGAIMIAVGVLPLIALAITRATTTPYVRDLPTSPLGTDLGTSRAGVDPLALPAPRTPLSLPVTHRMEHQEVRGVILQSPGPVRVEDRDVPQILEPTDAIIRLSATCICGSDLRLAGWVSPCIARWGSGLGSSCLEQPTRGPADCRGGLTLLTAAVGASLHDVRRGDRQAS